MSEMVERVARAMCVAEGHNPDWNYDPQEISKSGDLRWKLYAPQARAVLSAIREPTKAMIDAGMAERNVSGSGPRGLPLCFSAMIDAALTP